VIGRIIGIDYGQRRVGIALSDPLGITAQPKAQVDRSEALSRIARLVAEEAVVEVVVGLPLSMDGTESDITREVRVFVEQLEAALPVPVVVSDERLTTRLVERMLVEEADLSRAKRKKNRDKLAAVIILQGYLNARSSL